MLAHVLDYFMNTFTLLIFYLPVFIFTYSIHLYIVKLKKQENYSFLNKKNLNIFHFTVLFILIFELFFWFIIPAYNYAF
jgi:hypothetical protein